MQNGERKKLQDGRRFLNGNGSRIFCTNSTLSSLSHAFQQALDLEEWKAWRVVSILPETEGFCCRFGPAADRRKPNLRCFSLFSAAAEQSWAFYFMPRTAFSPIFCRIAYNRKRNAAE
ncbi:hypothetical protein BaRGS_00015486 [Batillaria attramentaria]|uniref:Uncharacterized protein n=1 Tax=Batillaria attramentaria TaxID=370345 RepID=A0ABD0L2J5_9CAEN